MRNSGNFVYPQNSLPFCNFDLFSRMTSIVHLMPSAASCLAERCCIPYFCLRHFTLFTFTSSHMPSSHLMHICIACRLGFAHLSCYILISSNKWKHSIEMYLYKQILSAERIFGRKIQIFILFQINFGFNINFCFRFRIKFSFRFTIFQIFRFSNNQKYIQNFYFKFSKFSDFRNFCFRTSEF